MAPADELPAPLPPRRQSPPAEPKPVAVPGRDPSTPAGPAHLPVPVAVPAPPEPATTEHLPPPEPRAPVPGAGPEVREMDLDWRSVVVALAAFVVLLAVTGVVGTVPRTLAALAVGTILALALDPVVGKVSARLGIGRAGAVAVVLALAGVAVALLALLLVPPAIRQARDLGSELPEVVAELGNLPLIGDDLEEAGVPERVRESIEELPDRLAGDTTPLERAAQSAADGLLAAAVTMLFALTLLVDGHRLLRGARRLVPPAERSRADRVARLAYEVVGRYVAGSLTVAAVAGIAVLIAGLALGVPLTPLAAAWVAIWDLVPQIGGAAGGLPFVLLGLTQGVGTGLACAVFFILYLQLENHVLGPLLVGKAVKLSPPATMTAALVGVSAGGVVGALLAVPVVGAAKAVYLEARPPPPRPPGPHEARAER
ncbi:MAG: AI-2E family transporter [Acidimicrobiales bacterium]